MITTLTKLKYLGKTHLYEQFKTALKAQTSAKKEQIDTLTARITQLQQNSSKELADLEATQSVILIKKAISQDYETFKANRFAKSVLEKNENLNSVIQSRAYLNSCIHYARLVYNSGKYEESYKMINILYSLVDEPADIMNLIWARLANGLVLSVKGDEEVGRNVAEEFKSIKARFDVKNVQSQTQRVAMSASLVYYALIAFFFAAQKDLKFDFIFELFLDEKYLGAIQLGSPHLLRYLVLLYMISYEKKSLKVDHRTLVSIIKNDVFEYSDVFTDFVRKLYISFSLSDIRDQIEKIKQEVEKDLIFSAHANIIVENCKKMYFEVYCKIYNSVDIQTVAEFLGISMEDAEVWLVNLIRKNNIKASVDPSGKSLEIGVIGADEVDTLNKRTKELMGRNRIILSNVTKVLDHHHHQHQSK